MEEKNKSLLKMNSILIEVIINNQCNKRCPYCDLDFRNKSLSYANIDTLSTFLDKNTSQVSYFHINFFWWEPLLSFDKIVYFVERQMMKNIQYSIGTNGILLNSENLNFLKIHNISISLSIDNITGFSQIEILKGYEDIISINFINDPDFMDNSRFIFDTISKYKFKKIHCMPVYSSKKWNTSSLAKLLDLKKYIDTRNLPVQYFSYFNWVSKDIQFILDTNMFFYKDIDSLLWLQKQYKKLPSDLKEKIDIFSRVCLLEKNLDIHTMIKSYNLKEMTKLVLQIPQKIGTYKDNLIIDKIFHYGA